MKYLLIIIAFVSFCGGSCSKSPSSFDEQVAAAEATLGLGHPKEALADYRSIAKRFRGDPRRAGVLVRVGDLQATLLNDPASAIRSYGEAIGESPLSPAAQVARERRAALREEKGEHEGAIEDYSALLKYYPDDANRYRYQILLGGVYLSARNYRQARVELKLLIESKDTPPEAREQALFIAAESFFLEGKNDRAIEYYRWFLNDFPKSALAAEAKLHLANCYEDQGQLGAARELTKNAADYPNKKVVDAHLKSLGDRGKSPPEARALKGKGKPQVR